ncbi:MAG: hypothetical protein JWO97_1128 [Acidobacteria bacterium]|nr:hypothetical protein [Acidobacteriota bacterium]
MELLTIGFTKKSAEEFFTMLRAAGVRQVVDVRLNNVSQLAGFTKKNDLAFFLREVLDAGYVHELRLAPAAEQLEAYRSGAVSWEEYEVAYSALLRERKVEKSVPRSLFEVRSVLLCSEEKPEHCHRRLAAEYLAKKWRDVTITHL